jgi:RES domain
VRPSGGADPRNPPSRGTVMAAGPSGAAPLPPPWLARRSLPILDLSAGTRVFRIHRLSHSAVFFGPQIDPATGRRRAPTYRFDSASGSFGVLYAAERLEGAFVETILRNPQLTFVSQNYIRLRCVTELTFSRDLRLVDMRGRGLSGSERQTQSQPAPTRLAGLGRITSTLTGTSRAE